MSVRDKPTPKPKERKLNKEKMIHKQFQCDVPEGGIDIQFNLEYNGENIMVNTIQINGNFNTGLPESPTLEWHNDKWMLCRNYKTELNGQEVDATEYINTDLSNNIVNKILEIKEQEVPGFTE
jgi:hypothetical protein